MYKFITKLTCLSVISATTVSAQALNQPKSFTTNCKVCHELDKALVGPSLIEIAKLYPKKKSKEFLAWCIEPGKKRPNMAQMPSMAHIPEDDLKFIHTYILNVTKGLDERVKTSKDLYIDSPTAKARPRVTRTFVPGASPASMIIALPTSNDHNIIWDTTHCRLRYISVGKIDNFPYLRSNGNSLAKVGKAIYTEEPLFSPDLKCQYMGYQQSKDGYPTLLYTLSDSSGKVTTITEKISAKDDTITRTITADTALPKYRKLKSDKKLQTEMKVTGNTLTITHKSL